MFTLLEDRQTHKHYELLINQEHDIAKRRINISKNMNIFSMISANETI